MVDDDEAAADAFIDECGGDDDVDRHKNGGGNDNLDDCSFCADVELCTTVSSDGNDMVTRDEEEKDALENAFAGEHLREDCFRARLDAEVDAVVAVAVNAEIDDDMLYERYKCNRTSKKLAN